MSALVFNNKQLNVLEKNNQIWISASDLANALNYKRADYITRIYNRNADEFTNNMTETVKLTLSGNLSKTVRFFSLRGAHLIAMFANTDIAKMFRKWVLDILDKESSQQVSIPTVAQIPHHGRWVVQYIEDKVEVKNIDGKVCVDNELIRQLQKDSIYYRNKLNDLNQQMQKFFVLTSSYAERTRITSGECDTSLFSIPLELI